MYQSCWPYMYAYSRIPTRGSPMLLLTMIPPSCSTRCLSSSRAGFWSSVSDTAAPRRHSTARLSPTHAVCRCRLSLIRQTTAVVPEYLSLSVVKWKTYRAGIVFPKNQKLTSAFVITYMGFIRTAGRCKEPSTPWGALSTRPTSR